MAADRQSDEITSSSRGADLSGDADLGPVLVIELVDRDRLDVIAAGSFASADRDLIAERLERLLACGLSQVRIDCTDVTTFEPPVAQLFATAGSRLEANGGALEVVNLDPATAVTPLDSSER